MRTFMAGMIIALLLFCLMPVVRQAANRARQRFYLWNLRMLADVADATMVAATAIVANDRPAGHHFTGSFTLDPGSIAAGGREQETVAIPGVVVGDVLVITNRTAIGLIASAARVTGAGTIEFYLENNTAGALDQASGIFDFAVIRGTTMALR